MIYIQSDSERKLPHHFDAACALYGAIDCGEEFRLTSIEEVMSGKFDALIRSKLFVGSTEFMREVFKRIGLTDVRVPSNSNRDFELITLGEAQAKAKSGTKLFIKPVEIKLFTGLVLDEMEYVSLNGLPSETIVMAYQPFNSRLVSEWRVYVHNHKMVDSRNYSGDYTQNINYAYVNAIIMKNQPHGFPSAYTIDIGVLESEENVVVEFNDMWAIGNYGMPNDIYLDLLKTRYFQIVNG